MCKSLLEGYPLQNVISKTKITQATVLLQVYRVVGVHVSSFRPLPCASLSWRATQHRTLWSWHWIQYCYRVLGGHMSAFRPLLCASLSWRATQHRTLWSWRWTQWRSWPCTPWSTCPAMHHACLPSWTLTCGMVSTSPAYTTCVCWPGVDLTCGILVMWRYSSPHSNRDNDDDNSVQS